MPSLETVDKAIRAIKNAADAEYFFSRLTSPGWIEPLRRRGFFQAPPGPEIDGKYIRFPFWPESQYLACMASEEPVLVLQVLQSIPATENPRVHHDILDAALAMPADHAVRLVPAAISWLESPYLLLVPHKLAQVAIKLAQEGQIRSAFDIAGALLKPLTTEQDESGGPAPRYLFSVRSRYSNWEYEQIAREVILRLAAIDPARAVDLLSDLLQEAVQITAPGENPPYDGSHIWRSAIEPSPQNLSVPEVRDVLIELLRDTTQSYVSADTTVLSTVVAKLEERPWRIFHRVALSLLRTQLDAGWDLVRDRVLDPDRVDDLHQYHEFWLLVQAAFPRLDTADQQRIIEAIEGGPVETPADVDPEEYARYWRRRRLAILKDVLGATWRHHYDDLVAEIGPESAHPEFLIHGTGLMVGPSSPRTADELLAMADTEVINFLREWESTGEFMAPSDEGLSRALSQAVTQQPQRFAEIAAQFRSVPLAYIRGAIDGWREALRSSCSFAWDSVLDLCQWVLDTHPTTSREDEGLSAEGTWTRQAIARLIEAGFADEEQGIPLDLRGQAWATLEPLAQDTDPTPEREAELGGPNMSPPALAINTTRGVALHAVVRYALWVHRLAIKLTEAADGVSRALPSEVRDILDAHLNPVVDSSAAVRSVYGQWLPQLIFLDQSWVEQRLSAIFPNDPALRQLYDAAWDTYVEFCDAHDSVFTALRNQYAKAVERIEPSAPASGSILRGSPNVGLARHLMKLVLRGVIRVDDDLVTTFFRRASGEVRKAALTFVGQAIQTSDELPSEVIARAQTLWQARTAQMEGQLQREENEASSFGHWFGSGKFPDEWSIEQLIEALRLGGGKIIFNHAVFDRLAEVVRTYPHKSVEAVRLLAAGDKEGWTITAYLGDIRAILAAALESDDPTARRAATDLAHALGARGFSDLRSLLSTRDNRGGS
ncbi:MAG: hypothetical protein WCF33_20785 [Pseudonocardiaceae bacterium]